MSGTDRNSDESRASRRYRIRFGTAQFDESRLELKVDGEAVALQRKPLQVLQLLLAHAGEVVTQDELFDVVWKRRLTVPNVLPNAVAKLREALGDNAQFVTTVPRVGYRFDGRIDERVVVADDTPDSTFDLKQGDPVPGRTHYRLQRRLGRATGSETWLAVHGKTEARRVFKFAVDGPRLTALKREVALYRVMRDAAMRDTALVEIFDWNFGAAPYFIECAYGGQDLIAWAEAEGRLAATPLPARVELLARMAEVLARAHAAGVLHKDLKPANVLVDDGTNPPTIRLIDFGSARLLERRAREDLAITGLDLTATRILYDASGGTPLYLAPELLRGEAPTVRADVYALGLIAYQVLAGDLRRPLSPGWERDIADPLLRDDVRAATDGDPERRIGTAAELAMRWRTLAERRHDGAQRAALAAAAAEATRQAERARQRRPWMIAAAVAAVLGIGASTTFAWQTRVALTAEQQQVRTIGALNRLLVDDVIGAASPGLTGRADITVAEAIERAAGRIDVKYGDLAGEVRGALHQALQGAFNSLGRFDDSLAAGDRALAVLTGDDLASRRRRFDVLITQADGRMSRSEGEAAGRLLDEATTIARDFPPEDGLQAEILELRSGILVLASKYQEALPIAEAARAAAAQSPGLSPRTRDRIDMNLVDLYRLLGQPDRAIELGRPLHARLVERFGARDPRPAQARLILAAALASQQRLDEALAEVEAVIPIFDQTLGPQHLRSLLARSALADVQLRKGEYDLAYDTWLPVAEGFAAANGESSDITLALRLNMATARVRAGRAAEVAGMLQRTLEAARKTLPPDAPRLHALRFYLAEALLDARRAGEAAPLTRELDPQALAQAQPQSDWPARLAFQQGRIQLALGRRPEALAALQAARQLSDPLADSDRSIDGRRLAELIRAAGG